MFISVNNNIINEKRITTIEVDRDTPSEVNYYLNDGGYLKEKFKTAAEASIRVKALDEKHSLFMSTNDERLINVFYIKDIRKDFINPKRMVYVLYNGAPIKERYSSEREVESMIKTSKKKLEELVHCFGSDGEGSGDGSTSGAKLEKTITSNISVGAATAGTLFPEGQTFTEFAELILKKDITPTINTFFSGVGLKEVGTTVNGSAIALNITNENSVTVPINTINFYDGNNLIDSQSYVSGQSRYSFTYNKNITTNTTLKAELIYNGSSKVSETGSFTFVYASYYGVTDMLTISDADATILATTFKKDLKNTKALTWKNITLDDEKFCYMYPKSFGALSSIKDENGFSQIDGYTILTVNLTSPINGNIVPYYVYLLTDATTGDNFTQIYG